MHRELLPRRLLALATALAIAACGAPSTAPTPTAAVTAPTTAAAGEPVAISFGAGEYERSIYQPLIDQFNQEHPDIRVQFVALDEIFQSQGASFDSVAVARQIVSTADTAVYWTLDEEAVGRGYFRDLAPLMDADPAFDREDFFPGALASAQVQGGTFMLPRDMYLSLLAYNKDLWAARGVPPPSPDWRWAEFVAAAEQLASTRGDAVEVYGFLDWGGVTMLSGELAQRDPQFSWASVGETRLDAPEVVAALERLAALAESGAIWIPPRTSGGDEIRNAIMGQQVGMWSSGSLWHDPSDPPEFAIGTAAFPPLGGLPSRYVQGYVMSAGTQHPEAAWRWLSFVSAQRVAAPGGEQRVEQIPARRSIAEASGYWDGLDDEARAAVQVVLERQDVGGGQPFDPHLFDLLTQAVVAATSGEATPAAALGEAQAAYEEVLVQAEQTPTPAAESIVVATPPPVVAAAEGATRLAFHVGWDDGTLRRVVEQFNREHPAVFVELLGDMSGAAGPESLGDVAGQADVFFWYGLPPEDEPITATLDLRPLMDADPTFARDDYPAGLLARFARDGAQYGLPHVVALRTLVYNADAFADAGIQPPQPGWTLVDFVAAAEQLSGGEGEERRYGFGENSTSTLDFFLEAAGVELTTGVGEARAPNFTDPAVVAATQQYVEFARSSTPDETLSGYTRSAWSDSYQLRQEGRIGMWFTYGLNSWELAEGASFKVGVTAPPLPTGEGDAGAFWGNGLFISAETEHVEEAWQFVVWMSGRLDTLQGGFPARISLAESPEFARQAPEGAAEVYAAYRPALERRPERAAGGGAAPFDLYWYYRAVDRAMEQPAALERELADAQELTEQFIACVRGGQAPGACARTVDPQYEGYMQEE